MLLQNSITATIWNFIKNPSFIWSDTGAQPIYAGDTASGLSRTTGVDATFGGPSLGEWNNSLNDLYERVFYLKGIQDSQIGRGYDGLNIVNNSIALTPANCGYLTQVVNETPSETVESVTVTVGGSGYANSFAVSFTGGGGSGAAATATAVAGVIQSVAITSPGSGYTSPPTAVFTAGGGSGVTATVIVSEGPPPITLTLPARADMMAAGINSGSISTSAPWFTAGGGVLPPIVIEGYTSANGTPLAITVNNTTLNTTDYPQNIKFNGDAIHEFQTVYLYQGEYAEFVPEIYVLGGVYLLAWEVLVHKSGYGTAGNYVQAPPDVVQLGQIKADGSTISRALYPRLWQYVNSQPFSTSGLVAQGSKTNPVYGNGDGSTTFSLPNMSGSADAALLQHNIIY